MMEAGIVDVVEQTQQMYPGRLLFFPACTIFTAPCSFVLGHVIRKGGGRGEITAMR
jgi:hypothetical protein